jgi:hypothetical protein
LTTRTVPQIRAALVANAMWAHAHAATIHYAEIRPIDMVPWHTATFTTDCSGFSILMSKWTTDAPDPSGNGFNGTGNTDSVDCQLNTIEGHYVQPGDFVIYGPVTHTNHMAIFVEPVNGQAMVVSHGTEAGPSYMSLADLTAGFPGQRVAYKQLIPGDNLAVK